MGFVKCTTTLDQGGWRADVGDIFDDSHIYVVRYPGNFSDLVDVQVTGTSTFGTVSAGNLTFGTPEAVTIASGVATITKSFVVLDAEGAGTTDQLDTITMAGVAAGHLLLLTVNATDTITVDDANINLAAATRAVAPGGSLLLFYDGTEWTEIHFTAATDNV